LRRRPKSPQNQSANVEKKLGDGRSRGQRSSRGPDQGPRRAPAGKHRRRRDRYGHGVAMGWSIPYTRGVLFPWKMGPAYCRAVLLYNERITLDGSPAEPVDAEAKELATKQLAKLAAKKAASAVTKPKPPTKPPSPSRDRVRAPLGRRG
jgi:hypothetical protein